MTFNQNLKLEIGNSRSGLHHAYLLEGIAESILKELHEFLEEGLSFHIKGNPDFWHGAFDTFGIDDGRALKEMQSRRPVGERKIFIVQANFFTREAQNALLKVFEEPTPNTHFFIITQNTASLLPTLRSRLAVISNISRSDLYKYKGQTFIFAEGFLTATGAARIEMLKKMIEAKDKNTAISFLNSLEEALYNNDGRATSVKTLYGNDGFYGRRTSVKGVFVFEEIWKARSYLNDRAPSVKMILEHIALTVPSKII